MWSPCGREFYHSHIPCIFWIDHITRNGKLENETENLFVIVDFFFALIKKKENKERRLQKIENGNISIKIIKKFKVFRLILLECFILSICYLSFFISLFECAAAKKNAFFFLQPPKRPFSRDFLWSKKAKCDWIGRFQKKVF